MKRILTSIAENHVFANIIFLVIFLAGIIAVMLMVKEDLPVMAEDMIQISVVWDGADPVSVEEGIIRKIEMATQGLEGISDIRTTAFENMGEATVLIKSGYDPQWVLDQVRARIDSISTFPEAARKPVVVRPVQSFAVMTLFLNGDTDEKLLKETGLVIKEEMLRLEALSQINLTGMREYEINIEVSQQTLERYGLEIEDITRVISENNLELAAGNIKNKDQNFRLRTVGKKSSAKEIGSIVVVNGPGGELIPLNKIARISDGFSQKISFTRVNGKPGVLINIYKTEKEDAIDISKTVTEYIEAKETELDSRLHLSILYDSSNATKDRINSLVKNGTAGLFFVMLILWLFIDARLAFWVAAGIPFSLMGGLMILWLCSGTLNMVSLFSLIMVMGIIADDAIVVGEAILYHRKQNKSALEAVLLGVKEVGKPVFVAVITSIVAFLPLLFIQGMMGKFIAILPLTIISCLLISLIECFILLPAHLNIKRTQSSGVKRYINYFSNIFSSLMDRFVQNVYSPFITMVLKFRYQTISMAFGFLFIIAGFMLGGFLQFDLFPDTQGSVITATVEFPDGSRIEKTKQAIEKLEQALNQTAGQVKGNTGDPIIINMVSITGHLLGDEAGEIEESGPHYGSIQVVLVPPGDRNIHTETIMQQWKKALGDIHDARNISFFTDSLGMEGPPIEIDILGKDLKDLTEAGETIKSYLQRFEGVYQVRSDVDHGKSEIRLSLKPEARVLDISLQELSQQVHDMYFGRKALTLQRGNEEVDVYVRLDKNERENLSSLSQVKIRTKNGDLVPLSVVANVELSEGVSRIDRKNRLRKVSITAYVSQKDANADQIMEELADSYLPEFESMFPHVQVAFGGDEEEEEMTFDSLIFGFPMAIIVIYLIIAATFKSYSQPLIILFIIPFGIAGSILGHMFLGFNLSLMSIFGMVAITGVLINDSIVLLESIQSNKGKNNNYIDAVILGSKRRFRAVFLTSISTVVGLAPLILETNPHIQLLIPMAVSIVGGIVFSTLITLILIPGFVLVLNDIKTSFIYKN